MILLFFVALGSTHLLGGADAESIPVPTDQEPIYHGCYKDCSETRIYSHRLANSDDNNTPNTCLDRCLGEGFPYGAVQSNDECYCGALPYLEDRKVDESDCTLPCTGDANLICGDHWRNSVYSYTRSPLAVPSYQAPTYHGCFNFTDEGAPAADTADTAEPTTCLNGCYDLGYRYSVLLREGECNCDDWPPSEDHRIVTDDCEAEGGDAAYSYEEIVSRPPLPVPSDSDFVLTYLGCFGDCKEKRFFQDVGLGTHSYNTPQNCVERCYAKGYTYGAVQNQNECYCGQSAYPELMRVDESECNEPCSGFGGIMCGGDWRNSVYYYKESDTSGYDGNNTNDFNNTDTSGYNGNNTNDFNNTDTSGYDGNNTNDFNNTDDQASTTTTPMTIATGTSEVTTGTTTDTVAYDASMDASGYDLNGLNFAYTSCFIPGNATDVDGTFQVRSNNTADLITCATNCFTAGGYDYLATQRINENRVDCLCGNKDPWELMQESNKASVCETGWNAEEYGISVYSFGSF